MSSFSRSTTGAIFFENFSLFRLFRKLYLAVTSGLSEKMASEKKRKEMKRVKKASVQNAASKEASSDEEMLRSRFALC